LTLQGVNYVLTDGSNTNPYLPRTMTITLPSGITAVGMDLYTVQIGDGNSNTVSNATFTVNGESFVVSTYEKPTLAFAGFTSTTPITSLTITVPNGSWVNLSNFEFGQAVPEPSSFVSLAVGVSLSTLIWRARRWRR
jgi:hypothetical protein